MAYRVSASYTWRYWTAVGVALFVIVVVPSVWWYQTNVAPYPRSTTDVKVEAGGACLNTDVFAFGNYWIGIAPHGWGGIFRQVDPTHAVYGGVTFRLMGKFNDLECDIR